MVDVTEDTVGGGAPLSYPFTNAVELQLPAKRSNLPSRFISITFILPKDDEPTLITIPFEIAQVEQTTYFKKFFTTSALFGHPEFISNTLKKIGLGNAVIGAELGTEQYLGMSYLGFQEIEKHLSYE